MVSLLIIVYVYFHQKDCDLNKKPSIYIYITSSSGFRGGGIRPPAYPKGPPFLLFRDIHFWLADLKIFLKAPSCQSILILRGKRVPKKRNFLVKVFQKVPKMAFFGLFFLIASGAENLVKFGSL